MHSEGSLPSFITQSECRMQSLRAARRGSQKLDMMWNFGPHLGTSGSVLPRAKCCFPTQSSHRHGPFGPFHGEDTADSEADEVRGCTPGTVPRCGIVNGSPFTDHLLRSLAAALERTVGQSACLCARLHSSSLQCTMMTPHNHTSGSWWDTVH